MENQSYSNYITARYGDNTYDIINKYQDADKSSKLLTLDIEFLSKCKKSDIIPIHCRLGGRRSVSPNTRKILKKTEKKLLNRSISKNYSKRWKCRQEKGFYELRIEGTLCLKDYILLQNITESKISRSIEIKAEKLNEKFERLLCVNAKHYSNVTQGEKDIY